MEDLQNLMEKGVHPGLPPVTAPLSYTVFQALGLAPVSGFDDLFPHGKIEEKKELIGLFVEKIELDSTAKVGKVYIKRFPVPTNGTGKSFEMVAGARHTHQKKNFPPIDVIDIQFEYQGSALVPVNG